MYTRTQALKQASKQADKQASKMLASVILPLTAACKHSCFRASLHVAMQHSHNLSPQLQQLLLLQLLLLQAVLRNATPQFRNLKSNSAMRLATATVETSSDYC
jgi:hypothetical protein